MENIVQKITKPQTALLVTNIINLTYSFLKYSDVHYDNDQNICTKQGV